MMMYFEFNEDKLKQNNLTKEQCFRVIDKVMNEYGVYGEGGIYIASDESDTWYEEREDFSRVAIGTERKAHKEERGFELLQGSEIFQRRIIRWMFGKPL